MYWSKSARLVAALVVAISAVGCTGIQKALGIKQDLEKERVTSIAIRLEDAALCPGDETGLIVEVHLEDGRTLVSDGAGRGKVTWDSFRVSTEAAAKVKRDGQVALSEDPRSNLRTPPALSVTLTHHPNVSARLDVPVRFDCHYTVDLSGADGEDGEDGENGADAAEGSSAQNGSAGADGESGTDGRDATVRLALVEAQDQRTLLQVHVAGSDPRSDRFFLIDPNGSVLLKARGGNGGSGGDGGDGGEPNGHGASAGSGGDGGRGGDITVVIDEDARRYEDRLRIEAEGGERGRRGSQGSHASKIGISFASVLTGVASALVASDGTDGEDGQVKVRHEPLEPLWQ